MARGRKLESIADFNRSLKNKYGIGEGSGYKPWLRCQDVRSDGVKSQIWGNKTGRVHHLLSSNESEFFYLAEFSDSVIDIREQFPLLPLNVSQKIAATLGVEHPKVPNTRVPNIMTTDFLLTCRKEGRIFYKAVSVKPDDGMDQRVAEKLDIERVWWELLGVEFYFFIGNELTKTQSDNIQWATSPFRSGMQTYTASQIQIAMAMIEPGKYLLSDICGKLLPLIQGRSEDGLNIVRYLIANKFIDIDLSYSVESNGGFEVLSINVDKRQVSNGD
jgi:hypothetical protein